MPHPVFLSYARRASREHAERLWGVLEGTAAHAFLDSDAIEYGDTFPRTLTDAILDASVFVLFADQAYFTRWYCLRELRLALAAYEAFTERQADPRERRAALAHIVVALSPDGVDDITLRRLPPPLTQVSWPRADDTASLARLVAERLETIQRIREGHAAARVPAAWLSTMVAEAPLPSAGNLAGIPLYPVDMPPSILGDFVGRDGELWLLDYYLSTVRGEPASMAALTGAMTGGAGYGKTRLALEYLHRFGPLHFPGGLLWVDAARPTELLDEQFYGIWRCLDPSRHTRTLKEFRDAGESVRDTLAAALHDAPTAKPILFVVDNVEAPQPGEPPKPLDTWCPALGKVTVLVTSRFRPVAFALGIRPIEVDVLEDTAAIHLLTRGIDASVASSNVWAQVAAGVGNLPLALELLNAALKCGVITPSEFLDRITQQGSTKVLDDTMHLLSDQVPEGALRGISEALLISYERLPEAARTAARVLASFGPEPIPLQLADAVFPPEHRAEIRGRLLSLSIATPLAASEVGGVALFGRVHRVVADFLRCQSNEDGGEVRSALGALCTVITRGAKTPQEWPLVIAVLPHALAILAHLGETNACDTLSASTTAGLGQVLTEFGEQAGENGALVTAIAAYRHTLKGDTRDQVPLDWAMTQTNLGNALHTLGEREAGTAHLEEAVTAYRAALTERTRERVPLDWATTHNNLGAALRTLGEREAGTARLEEAVAAYRAVLTERTRERVPLRWAATQDNLGNALQNLGERETGTARLEEAVAAYRAALTERTRERVPLQWARTQNNLGAALQALGERETGTARLEEAVAAYRAALTERTRERVPLQWATTQTNLGSALETLGARELESAHLEEAVAAYRVALAERARERVPLQWAATQNNLGNALATLGEREAGTARLEEAVAAYRAALTERTRERVPLQWAATQTNLGNALSTLGERKVGTTHLEEAVAAYRVALAERTRERVPLQWAATQNNLGNALQTLGEREGGTARLEEAVTAFRAALTEFTSERVPFDWAMTQNNLGNALQTLGARELESAHLEEAVAAYRAALTVFTPETSAYYSQEVRDNLQHAESLLAERRSQS